MRIEFCWNSSDGLTLAYLSFREQFGRQWWIATPAKGFASHRFVTIKRLPNCVVLHAPHVTFAGCTTQSPTRSDIYMQRFVGHTKNSGLLQHMFTVTREHNEFVIMPTSNFVELVTELALGAHYSQSNDPV